MYTLKTFIQCAQRVTSFTRADAIILWCVLCESIIWNYTASYFTLCMVNRTFGCARTSVGMCKWYSAPQLHTYDDTMLYVPGAFVPHARSCRVEHPKIGAICTHIEHQSQIHAHALCTLHTNTFICFGKAFMFPVSLLVVDAPGFEKPTQTCAEVIQNL